MKPPRLVFGWGNPARGDDGLGPAFIGEAERVDGTELLVDYQLQPEHALDLVGRSEVLFVDACASTERSFEVGPVEPEPFQSVTTHHLTPGAVLAVFEHITGRRAPPARLLRIHGEVFGLGEALSETARKNLDEALAWWRETMCPKGPPGADRLRR